MVVRGKRVLRNVGARKISPHSIVQKGILLTQGVRLRKTAHVEIVCMHFENDAKTKLMLGHAVSGQNP